MRDGPDPREERDLEPNPWDEEPNKDDMERSPHEMRMVRAHDMKWALVDALSWFEEHIGHDGAPDGGDPEWVTRAVDSICRFDGLTYPPDYWDHIEALRKGNT